MSDAVKYFRSHAVEAALKARRMARGRIRDKQRMVARMYHLIANHLLITAADHGNSAVSEVLERAKPSGFRNKV
jgi:predicted solute-binding protein